MKYFLGILFLLLSAALATSCIKEDRSDCPPPEAGGFWITFDMLNPYLKYTEEVRHLGLIFYDMTGTPTRAGEPTPGKLVAGFQYELDQLRPSDKAA